MKHPLFIVVLTLVLAAALHGQWQEVSLPPGESVWASSFLSETIAGRQYSYGPDALFDSDLSTPWVEGAEGDGTGESVTILTNRPVLGFSLVNGFASPLHLFKKNGRVKDARLTLLIGFTAPGLVSEMDYTLYFLREFDAGIHSLADSPDWQTLNVALGSDEQFELCRTVLTEFADEKTLLYEMMLKENDLDEVELLENEQLMQLMEIYGFMALRLEIDSVYPGSRYQDCCLSEIKIHLGEF